MAQVITRTAPDTSLYLATVQTPTDIAAALDYFTENSVDIVVMSIGYPTLNDDGQHILAQPIAEAQANGALVITSAGNQRESHWEGEFTDTNGNGYHEFSETVGERQCVPSCTQFARSGQITAVLDWEREGDGSQYQIGLYDPTTTAVFQTSVEAYQTDRDNRQYLSAQITQRPVDLVINNTKGPANDELELHLYNRRVADPVGTSSVVPPSDSTAAFGVSAYVRNSKQIANYSSRGPTDDGRIQPQIAGYTNIQVNRYDRGFGGTSAAAPYVAGVAALVEDKTPDDQTPRMLRNQLQSTTDDINPPGTDTASGAGLLNASAIVTNNTTQPENTTSPVYDPNSTAAEYDKNGDGQITIVELASAGRAYINGALTIAELANVGRAYTNS